VASAFPLMTPISKLVLLVIGLACLLTSLLRRSLLAPKRPSSRQSRLETLVAVHPNAAGLDIGSAMIVVAVPPDRDAQPVRVFATFTPDLHALVAWLVACGIDTVAMESTGVYWIAIYELFEQTGITPYLVNAQHVKTVPGRKTDWNDAQWLQKLPMLGLLHASFRPDAEIRSVRVLARDRAELIRQRAPHSLHMQQALKQMNIQLREVLSDITGTTGQAIVRAIVAGERDPATLAQLRHPGCKHTEAEITKALTGTWQAAQIFILAQNLELSDFYPAQLAACDREMERFYQAIESRHEPNAPLPNLPAAKPGSRSKNKPNFNVRAQLARIVGGDLVGVMGLSDGVPLASRETDHKPIFDYLSTGGFLFWYTCDKTSADLRALTFRWRNRVWFRLAWFPDQTAIGFRVKIGQKGDGDIFSELIELTTRWGRIAGANRITS
jgi:transposase